MSVSSRACCALLCIAFAACAYSRDGWGRGRFIVVSESSTLQVRRSTMRIEAETGDLVMNWIGARVPSGSPDLTEFAVTVFDDLDGDGEPAASEIRARRDSSEASSKLLFSDVRVPKNAVNQNLRVLVQARTSAGRVTSNAFVFEPDP